MADQAGAGGLPGAAPQVERIARIVTAVAVTWIAVIALRGIAQPFGTGVTGLAGSAGVAADNMWHWHLLLPITHYAGGAPSPSEYAWQRPVGAFWACAIFVKLLGHHVFACRLTPALASIAIPLLLYAVGRSIWGPVQGALAAATFAVLPVVPAFANNDPAAPLATAGALLCCWGYVRMNQTWHVRWLAVAVAGLSCSVLSDWSAYAFAAVLLATGLLQQTLPLQRWLGRVDARRFSQWWALAAGLTVLAFLVQVYELHKARMMAHFLAGALERMRSGQAANQSILLRRDYWHAVALTPLGILLGYLALPVVAIRMLVFRRGLEVCVIAMLAMAIGDYIWVSRVDGLRSFWPWYFAPYIALAVGVLAASVEASGEAAVRSLRRTLQGPLIPLATFGVVGVVPILIAVQGRGASGTQRRLALRLKGDSLLIDPDLARSAALEWFQSRIDGPEQTVLSKTMGRETSDAWNLGRPIAKSGVYTIEDARTERPGKLSKWAQAHATVVVGPYWFQDRYSPPGPIEASVLTEQAPGRLTGYFALPGLTETSVQKNAWYTWELRDHFDQTPNPVPHGPLLTREDTRIAHNAALAAGNTATADKLESELLKALDRSAAVTYNDGVALLGQIYESGASPRLTLYFKASGPLAEGLQFHVREVVVRTPRLSFVPVDPIERHIGGAFAIDPSLWKAGYIYSVTDRLAPRSGQVRCYGYWHAPPWEKLPLPTKGPVKHTLLVLD